MPHSIHFTSSLTLSLHTCFLILATLSLLPRSPHTYTRTLPGYADADGLDEAQREVMDKLGFNDPRRHAYRRAAEQRIEDTRKGYLRVGSAKRYQPVPTLKELGREIDRRFRPMFGAGAASRLTSYVSCTVQFQSARELAGFAAYLKGYAFADPGSSKSLFRCVHDTVSHVLTQPPISPLLSHNREPPPHSRPAQGTSPLASRDPSHPYLLPRFVGVNNRFVKQGLTESSRRQQRCIPLRFLCPKWYLNRWRQRHEDEYGEAPEFGQGFEDLEYMVGDRLNRMCVGHTHTHGFTTLHTHILRRLLHNSYTHALTYSHSVLTNKHPHPHTHTHTHLYIHTLVLTRISANDSRTHHIRHPISAPGGIFRRDVLHPLPRHGV